MRMSSNGCAPLAAVGAAGDPGPHVLPGASWWSISMLRNVWDTGVHWLTGMHWLHCTCSGTLLLDTAMGHCNGTLQWDTLGRMHYFVPA